MCLLQKNYLREKELEEMGRIVNASLDMAESMAMRHIPMTMEDWANRIDKFINLFDSPILQDSGKVSAEYAKEFTESEFEKYRIIQDRLFNLILTDLIIAIFSQEIWMNDETNPPISLMKEVRDSFVKD